MDQFLSNLFTQAPILAALIAGVLSFISPCVLPLLPAYLSYMSGRSLQETKTQRPTLAILGQSLLFMLGFGIVFVLIGASLASIVGKFQTQLLRYFAGVVVIFFGLHFLGLFKLRFLYRSKTLDFKQKRFNKVLSPILLGMSLSLGWTPCVGPIFTSIIILGGFSPGSGISLLIVYVLGFTIPFLMLSIVLSRALNFLNVLKRNARTIEVVSGILLILVGIFIMIPNSETWFLG